MKHITKGGACRICGEKLPIPSWSLCFRHDKSKYIKHPPQIKPPFIIKPFKIHFGYEIKIPFDKYLRAKELIYDNWAIIGWR